MTTKTDVTTQMFRVYIKATPQAVWDGITDPEWTKRYGMGGVVEYDMRPGGVYKAYPGEAMKEHGAELGFPVPEVAMDGEVIEADPPHKLVQTFRMLIGDEATTKEGYTRLTWEINEMEPGLTKLTVIHDTEGAPILAAMVAGNMEDQGAGGGWSYVLSDLKSLLETGTSLRA